MNVCDRNEMRALLAKHGFHFSKAKGQNFLAAAWVPEQIAVEAGVGPDCGVVEIGPGIGSLTQQLCRHAGKVVAISRSWPRRWRGTRTWSFSGRTH